MKKTRVSFHGKSIVLMSICIGLFVAGCGPKLSTSDQVNQFEIAGPVGANTKLTDEAHTAPYRVVIGDILEFKMPASLRLISPEPDTSMEKVEPYLCRVSDTGTITLPIAGEIYVAGKTVSEIERLVADAYYPKYVVNRPVVVCEITKYQGENERVFTVMGLVNHPNAFPYPPGVRYNLMEALAFAGGFDMVADPKFVKIYRQDATGKIVSATFAVDSKSLSDTYRVTVKPGDVIYVDHTLSTRVNKFLTDILHVTVGYDFRSYNDD